MMRRVELVHRPCRVVLSRVRCRVRCRELWCVVLSPCAVLCVDLCYYSKPGACNSYFSNFQNKRRAHPRGRIALRAVPGRRFTHLCAPPPRAHRVESCPCPPARRTGPRRV